MKKLALAILLSTLPSPVWATTYFLATAAGGGSDSNNGTSPGTPWLTPYHAVNCGDVILAAASTAYSYANFDFGTWGTVACSGPGVAWLKCATFDACKIISSGGNPGIILDTSNWGIQGWEVSVTASTYAGCFIASANYSTQISIHHIIFANNVCNGAYAGGFACGLSTTGSVDYCAIIGNIAYNAAAGNNCYSGIDVYEPIQHDSLPGTHIYIAGNFSFGNFNTNPCYGGIPSDGEGINIDTLDGIFNGLSPYTAQVMVDNNILVANGGRGLEAENNSAGSTHAPIYFRHNTMWGNSLDTNQVSPWCPEVLIANALNVQSSFNIAVTNATNGCGGHPIYAYYVVNSGPTDRIYSNVGYSASGNYSAIVNSSGFSYDPNNLFGTSPSFANATAPGAPSCGNASSVPNCMATVIANFTPTVAAAKAYGYQIPLTKNIYDPLFPQWLCNVNLPAGLITMGCLAQSSVPASPTITGVKVQ